MHIEEYKKEYKKYFIEFNTQWITENFGHTEPEDKLMFDSVDEILADGAMIYFAVEGKNVLACCMTHIIKGDEWEICKLASNSKISHKGAGTAVFNACFDYAIANGARRLFLISNTKLKPALHIYEKAGFRQIVLDDYEYERGDIAFEYTVK